MIIIFSPSRRRFLFSVLIAAIGLKACQSQPSQTDGEAVILYGAGATFPSLLYLRWIQEYSVKYPHIQISYQPIGSAAGIQQFLSETTDFGATEVPLTDAELAQVKRGAVFIPLVAGSIAVVYSVPGIATGLKLSRQVLPAIFLGQITKWNDPAIAALNPELILPDLPITVVHRSDGSGTTAAFTAHLSAMSPEWEKAVGTGLSVEWKTGVGIKDNAGISAQIQQGEGVIGYVEYAFAKQLELATASLENKAGQFTLPTTEATTKAIAAIELSDDLRGSSADPDVADAYPIVTYSWLLAYQKYPDPKQGQALKDVIKWSLTEGQAMGLELGYVPLPQAIVNQAIAALDRIG